MALALAIWFFYVYTSTPIPLLPSPTPSPATPTITPDGRESGASITVDLLGDGGCEVVRVVTREPAPARPDHAAWPRDPETIATAERSPASQASPDCSAARNLSRHAAPSKSRR
ncbi:MAG: hypothetical protein ACREOV_04455 [Candidatus Dormibacteraceae bacterium]